MERVKTGISGLDEMLNGGIPKRRHVALFGGPGTGKTSFGFEYLYRGAKNGEPGIYITLEETPDDIIENMKNTFTEFKDINALVDKKLFVEKPDEFTIEKIAEMLESKITNNNVKRVVIDSATMIRAVFEKEGEYRKTVFEFFSLIRNLDCTAMVTVEAETASKEEMKYGIEHYVLDGIINLYSLDRGDRRVKAIEVFKMRGTDHSKDLVPFKLTPDGIKVYIGEKVF
ncbi:MAG: ATPase domain-containing protein [Candidatus Anstonellales archaeon]